MEPAMNYIAVITGDIVNSGILNATERKNMPEKLKRIFSSLSESPEPGGRPGPGESPGRKENLIHGQQFDIFRGDSFQGVVQESAKALRTGLWIKTSLMKTTAEFGSYDCRLAIGIGKAAFMASNALESDGEAFRYSGPALDAMEQEERLKIVTPWEQVNQEMQVACKLADMILKRWTAAQAGIITEALAGKTQNTIAASLDITQPAVSASLKTSGWNAIEELIKRYEILMKNHAL